MKIINCKNCKQNKQHCGLGLCRQCWNIQNCRKYHKTDAYRVSLLKSRMKMVQKAMNEMMANKT